MALAIVRLGSPRLEGEGLRIGTVRRPPRGVPKQAFASQDWYDVWFPNLAPSSDTIYQYLNFDQIAEYSDVAEGVGS